MMFRPVIYYCIEQIDHDPSTPVIQSLRPGVIRGLTTGQKEDSNVKESYRRSVPSQNEPHLSGEIQSSRYWTVFRGSISHFSDRRTVKNRPCDCPSRILATSALSLWVWNYFLFAEVGNWSQWAAKYCLVIASWHVNFKPTDSKNENRLAQWKPSMAQRGMW